LHVYVRKDISFVCSERGEREGEREQLRGYVRRKKEGRRYTGKGKGERTVKKGGKEEERGR